MKAISTDEIDEWLRKGSGHGLREVLLYQASLPAEWPGIVLADSEERANALFLQVFADLVLKFGVPVYPRAAAQNWRQTLGLSSRLVAVWNFDYYQLSLRVLATSEDDATVVLARHSS
jgi:hypothetical protein